MADIHKGKKVQYKVEYNTRYSTEYRREVQHSIWVQYSTGYWVYTVCSPDTLTKKNRNRTQLCTVKKGLWQWAQMKPHASWHYNTVFSAKKYILFV